MKFAEIRDMPTLMSKDELKGVVDSGSTGIHESVMRSYHIVQKIKELVELNVSREALLELIEFMESK